MDALHPDATLLCAEYRLLSRVNRIAGAAENLLDAMQRYQVLSPPGSATVVDFGSGGGDIAHRVLKLSRKLGSNIEVLCTDRSEHAVQVARAHGQHGCQYRTLDIRNAISTLGEKSFDVSHASLVLHHLDDDDVVAGLDAMRAVSRRLMVWSDLIRDRLGILGAFASGDPKGCDAQCAKEFHACGSSSAHRSCGMGTGRCQASEGWSIRRHRHTWHIPPKCAPAAPCGGPLMQYEGESRVQGTGIRCASRYGPACHWRERFGQEHALAMHRGRTIGRLWTRVD